MGEVEVRDPTIKLFGKTIALPLNHGGFVSSESSVPKARQKVPLFHGLLCFVISESLSIWPLPFSLFLGFLVFCCSSSF